MAFRSLYMFMMHVDLYQCSSSLSASVLLDLQHDVLCSLCSGDVEAQCHVRLGAGHGNCFFQYLNGAKKQGGGGSAILL